MIWILLIAYLVGYTIGALIIQFYVIPKVKKEMERETFDLHEGNFDWEFDRSHKSETKFTVGGG